MGQLSFVYRKHHPAYRKHHPALQWLPTKLAEWISNNLQDELGFPNKADPRRGWTPAELNSILQNHVVRNRDGCALLDNIRVCGMGV